jgi:hypothetical protein
MRGLITLLAIGMLSCGGGGSTCSVGEEGCECTSGGVCNPGLDCVGGVCVTETTDTATDTAVDTTADTGTPDTPAETECTVDLDCDDDDLCTTDTCDEYGDCQYDPFDGDEDGFISVECGGMDCDDDDATIYPGAAGVCDDGVDNDCDGSSDELAAIRWTEVPSSEGMGIGAHALVWTGSEFGVAWGNENEVRMIRLASDGAPIGSIVTLQDHVITGVACGTNTLAMDWTGSEYAILYTCSPDALPLRMSRVTGDGTVVGTDVGITAYTGPDLGGNLAVAWTGSEHAMVFGADHGDLEFAKVAADGSPGTPGSVVVSSTVFPYPPSLIWTGSDAHVAWLDTRDDPDPGDPDSIYAVYISRRSSTGEAIGSATRISDLPTAGTPSMVWTGSEIGILWARWSVAEVKFARVSASGSRIGSEVDIPMLGEDQTRLAWTGSEFVTLFFAGMGDCEAVPVVVSPLGAVSTGETSLLGGNCSGSGGDLTWTGSLLGATHWSMDTAILLTIFDHCDAPLLP